MGNYVYIESEHHAEGSLYTVGFYDPSGKWVPESDHDSKEKAAQRVNWLNGGEARKEGYEEATKRAIDMAVFNIPYISEFQKIPGRLVGIVIPGDEKKTEPQPLDEINQKSIELIELKLKEMVGKLVISVVDFAGYEEEGDRGFIIGFDDGSALRVRHVKNVNDMWVLYIK